MRTPVRVLLTLLVVLSSSLSAPAALAAPEAEAEAVSTAASGPVQVELGLPATVRAGAAFTVRLTARTFGAATDVTLDLVLAGPGWRAAISRPTARGLSLLDRTCDGDTCRIRLGGTLPAAGRAATFTLRAQSLGPARSVRHWATLTVTPAGQPVATIVRDLHLDPPRGLKQAAAPLPGLAVGVFDPGQRPGSLIGINQLRREIRWAALWAQALRSYGCDANLAPFGKLAHEQQRRAAVGVWLSRDRAENDRQLACGIQQARLGHVDTLILGSEALFRGDLTAGDLRAYVATARAALPYQRLAIADTYNELLKYPALLTDPNIDEIWFHAYGFWEGVPVEQAVDVLDRAYRQLASATTKEIVVGETSWPSCGRRGAAIGSIDNASFYARGAAAWARANAVRLFYLESRDQSWKGPLEGGEGAGACFGIASATVKRLKPGFAPLFLGSVPPLPGLAYLSVPADGNPNGVLVGRAWGVARGSVVTVTHLRKNGRYWVKPYADRTTIPLDARLRFTVDVTTGGEDATADLYVTHLIPAGWMPPVTIGGDSLPADLESRALARVVYQRRP
ncbi:MAG: hypothetical protein IT340_04445 [Chloroflexi bacterium]|nr:hypothetical protein [Chloroflexota bacterium]